MNRTRATNNCCIHGVPFQYPCEACEAARTGQPLSYSPPPLPKREPTAYDEEAKRSCELWSRARLARRNVSHKLGTGTPGSSAPVQELEATIDDWRVSIADAAICSYAKSGFYRRLVQDMLIHVFGEGRMLSAFRSAPTGADAPELLESELAQVLAKVASELKRHESSRPRVRATDSDHIDGAVAG